MYLLDTDVIIDVQRGYIPALTWFSGLSELPSTSGLVVMELVQDARNTREIQRVLKLVEPLPVVWPTQADCERALADFKIYHLSHSLGLIDSLIGACAVGLSATLCTFNIKHYRVIAGLKTEQPYSKSH
ncbi:VapC toxin family PIN domain ribonuclease [Chloroflexi bacterium TSY]|nr:VapC toxin family PIN domain ribonuclease [Chloroflexi bacterium TSY]